LDRRSRETRKGKEFIIYRKTIVMEFRAKIKIQSVSSVETGENPVHRKA
jgi:hypothetical protein